MRHQKRIPDTNTHDSSPDNVGLSIAHIRSLPHFEQLTEEEAKRVYILLRLIASVFVSAHTFNNESNQLLISLSQSELKEMIKQCITEVLPPPVIIPIDEPLLKRKEIADMLRISLVTLHQWMKEGRIPYHRIHSRIYFKASEVREALSRQDYKRASNRGI